MSSSFFLFLVVDRDCSAGRGISTSSRSCNPITQQTAFEKIGRMTFVDPLLPYTAPPTDAATSPSEQNTDARPRANDNVGRIISLSSRSSAAVDM